MAHRRSTKYFGRKFNAKKALLRGLIVSLVEHGRIKTTVVKAKELRRHVEKAITLGKKDDLASRRLLLSRVPNQNTVETIIGDISKRFASRPGGYTRIIKIGRRPGDKSEMAFIEFVDYDWEKSVATKSDAKAAKAEKAGKKETAKVVKKAVIAAAAKKKNVSKIQKKSRREARG
jgi:large subunit ribosomal protein L17